jgi:hypothetical protein
MSETKTTTAPKVDMKTGEEKQEVAVFEEIRRSTELATTEEKKVPLAMVFGHGTLGNIESFGGRSLVENTAAVDKALANAGELENVWNHSHSQWTWKHINLSYHSPWKNMRQISAEISRKKGALTEAKWRQVKNEIKIKKIQEQLQNGNEDGTLDYWKEVELKVKLAELQEGMVEGIKYIEGAMKDVLALNDMYEQLKSKVSGFSESDVEKNESKAHLKRSLVQCIRDVRQGGSITKGEQEYMEQIGVNPSKVQKLIRGYVASEEEQDNWDVSQLHGFVDQLTNELIDVYKVDDAVMAIQGFDPNPNEDYSFINTLALPKGQSEEEEEE